MMTADAPQIAPAPLFLEGTRGPLFGVLYARDRSPASGPALLFLPPFAEEANRSRRMMALLGRALAAQGTAVLVLDPLGTGDSAGDMETASWEQWLDDAARGLAWLRQRGYSDLAAGGLRTGAALALEAATRARLARVVLWQPVVTGRTFLAQFLRIRVTAALAGGGETTRGMRARLDDGETLEVAGYPLPPALAGALERLDLGTLGDAYDGDILWLQVTGDPGAPLPPPVCTVFKRWRGAGKPVTVTQVAGEPFWNIEETVLAPALIDATALMLHHGEPHHGEEVRA